MTRSVDLFRAMVAAAQCDHKCIGCFRNFMTMTCPVLFDYNNDSIDYEEYKKFLKSMTEFANMMVRTEYKLGDWTVEDIERILKEEELCD